MLRKLKIYNTLTNKKEELIVLEEGRVRIYACGVTVYDDCHIGHAMQAVFFDVFRHYLEYLGYQVTYVRNITDVDDKIIERAKKLKISPKLLAQQMIESSDKDMAGLHVRPADIQPRVSECISEIIKMIESLIHHQAAYVTSHGDVYYRVKDKENYGKLSNRNLEDLRVNTRKTSSQHKEDPLDFALWKKDDVQDASWDSPWGKGRPGWHIECSAMAKKFLGISFDIHGGGRDLIFPHHENEIAQSESANQAPYATCWMHSGLLTINGQKMSKSLGNHIPINDFIEKWDPEVLRLSYLSNHYSSNVDFSDRLFQVSRRRLYYYYQALNLLDKKLSTEDKQNIKSEAAVKEIEDFKERFHKSMCDDFNTALAIGEFNKFFHFTYKNLSTVNLSEALALALSTCIREIGEVFKILQKDPKSFIRENTKMILQDLQITEDEINHKLKLRSQARKNKDWQSSDRIRDELLGRGILLQDTKDGTEWIVKGLLA